MIFIGLCSQRDCEVLGTLPEERQYIRTIHSFNPSFRLSLFQAFSLSFPYPGGIEQPHLAHAELLVPPELQAAENVERGTLGLPRRYLNRMPRRQDTHSGSQMRRILLIAVFG